MIDKIKPTIAIRAEVRLIFSETEVFFGPHRDMLWE